MNIRSVLRTYSLLRQLSDDETALLNTLRSLSDSDREQLVESLAPQAKPKPRKKREAKSAHASSLREQIAGAATGKPHPGEGPVCVICSHTEDYEDHQQSSPHYHEFQPPQKAAATGD